MNKIEKKIGEAIKRIPHEVVERLRIDLLKRWEKKEGTVVIFPKPEIKRYPSLYFFGLISRDWPGSAGTSMGVITESGWNIATDWGMIFSYKGKKISMMLVGIEVKDEEELQKFLKERRKIREKLYEVCFEGWRKTKLLIHDIKKMEKYEDVMKTIKESGEFTEGVAEEVTKFFDARGEEYIADRSPKDLVDIILTNYKFIHKIRRTGGEPQVKVKHLKTKRERLTGISIGCYERDFSLLLALDAIREAVPDHQIKYNKEFVTDDKIAIYRIEIDGFQPEKAIEKSITKKISDKKFEKERVREVARGFEHYAKAIIPKLIKEYVGTKIPQLYISPELTSPDFIHFKLIVVKELSSPWTDKYIGELDKIRGVTVLGCETPKVYQESEVSVFDLRAETQVFPTTESIYGIIKSTLSSVFGEFRDFEEGMRKLEAQKFGEVKRKVMGVSSNILRQVYYGIEDFYRISAPIDETAEIVRLGVKLARGRREDIKWREFNQRCTLIGIASTKNILSLALKVLEGYEATVSKIQIGGLNLLLLRVEKQGKSLSRDETETIIQELTKIMLTLPDAQHSANT